jgi:hypothetical protein
VIGLDGNVLAVLLDDAAGDPVTVLQRHLVCPCGVQREAYERGQEDGFAFHE